MPNFPKCIARKIQCVKNRIKGSKAKGYTVNHEEQSASAASEAWCLLPENIPYSHEAHGSTQDHDSRLHEDTTVHGQAQRNQREVIAPDHTQHIQARSSQQNTQSSTRLRNSTTEAQTEGQNNAQTSGYARNELARQRVHQETPSVFTEEMESLPIDPEEGLVDFKPLDLVREDYELVRNPSEEEASARRNTGPYDDGPNAQSDPRRDYDGDFVLVPATRNQAQAAILHADPNYEDACASSNQAAALTNDEHLVVNAAATHQDIVNEFKEISLQEETGTLYEYDVARDADDCTEGRELLQEPLWESDIPAAEPLTQPQNVHSSTDIESDWVIVESVPPMNLQTSEGSRSPATASMANTSFLNRPPTQPGRIPHQSSSSFNYSTSAHHSPLNLRSAESEQRTLQTETFDDPQHSPHLNLRSAEAGRRTMTRAQSMSPSQQRHRADHLSRTPHSASSFPMPVTHSKSPPGWSNEPLNHRMNKVMKDVMNYSALIQEGLKSLERPVDAPTPQSMQAAGAGESEDMDAWNHGYPDASHVGAPDATQITDPDETLVKERFDQDDDVLVLPNPPKRRSSICG